MEVCYNADILESPAAGRLRHFVQTHERAWQGGVPDFEEYERELHEHLMALERDLIAAELACYDVSAAQMEVAGVVYHPVLSAMETYLSAAGRCGSNAICIAPRDATPRASARWSCGRASLPGIGRRTRHARVHSSWLT